MIEPSRPARVFIAPIGTPPPVTAADLDGVKWVEIGQTLEPLQFAPVKTLRLEPINVDALRPQTVTFPLSDAQAAIFRAALERAAQDAVVVVRRAFAQIAEALRPAVDAFARLGVIDTPPPVDPRARALEARKHRNTGPAGPRLDGRRR